MTRRDSPGRRIGDAGRRPRLVGRDKDLAHIVAALDSGVSSAVLLVGDGGVGKTRLAEECLARVVRRGAAPLRVLATRAAAALPLGALAPLLPRLDVPDIALLPAARQALLERGDGRRVTLLVDDAHLLDPVSAALIHQLVSTGQALAVLTARVGEPLPDALNALWKDERALRIDVPRLTDDDIAELARELLSGAVDLFTGRELARLAAGNPLALREIIVGARRAGVLRLDPQRGWLADGRIAAPPHVVDLVADRVAGLPIHHRDALRLVAYAEPIGLPVAVKLAGPDALDGLERVGLVLVEESGLRREVRLGHPLFGEAATRDMTTAERQAVLSRLADALRDTGMRRQDDVVRVADWRLSAGDVGDPALLLAAARRSLALHDLRSVVRFAGAARAVGGGASAEFLLGYAQSRIGAFADAEANLAAAMRTANRPPQIAMIGIARSENLLSGLANWHAAADVVAQTHRRVAATAHADEVRAHRARLLWLHGDAVAAFQTIEPLLAKPGSRAWVLGTVFLGVGLPWDARPLDALELADRATPVHEELWQRETIQFPPLVHDLGRLFSMLFAGRLDAAAELASALWTDASRTDLVPDLGLLAMLTGFVAKERGQMVQARRWLHRSLEIYERGSPTRIRWPLSLLVEVETDSRSHAAAQEAAHRLRTLTDGPIRNTDGMEEVFLARLAAAEGWMPEAVRTLSTVAERHRSSGRRTIAVYAVHALARMGRPEAGVRVADSLRTSVQGGLLAAMLDVTTAGAARDPAALSAAAEAFAAAGAWLYAAEAWTEASRCFRRRGDRRPATRAAGAAQECLRRCDGARSPLLAAADPRREALTSREREVAGLAAAGLSSKEIGERMFVSVRTVDNHLQRAYRKLGISSRDELADALDRLD